MIFFITNILEGENDILSSIKNEILYIVSLDGILMEKITPPEQGWTHSLLEKQAKILEHKTSLGADAFIGSKWVGSTEV